MVRVIRQSPKIGTTSHIFARSAPPRPRFGLPYVMFFLFFSRSRYLLHKSIGLYVKRRVERLNMHCRSETGRHAMM